MITKKINKSAQRISIFSMFLVTGAALAVGLDSFFAVAAHPEDAIASVLGATGEEIHAPANPFENISLEAKAVYVLNIKTGVVLFARDENEKLPLASVTKLMTALLAREQVSESAVITLTKDDLSAEGDSGLRSGERWRIGDLLNVMLLVSSNDAAHAVAGFVGSNGRLDQTTDMELSRAHFIQMMNERAHTLGLTKMEFFNESGLDIDASRAGGYASARDVAGLFAELWKKYPETVEITAHKDARVVSQDDIAHILPNTNEIVGHIPGLIASKTGYTTLAGGNLAVIFDRGIGEPILAIVLDSTYKGRFDDMKKLVETALKSL